MTPSPSGSRRVSASLDCSRRVSASLNCFQRVPTRPDGSAGLGDEPYEPPGRERKPHAKNGAHKCPTAKLASANLAMANMWERFGRVARVRMGWVGDGGATCGHDGHGVGKRNTQGQRRLKDSLTAKTARKKSAPTVRTGPGFHWLFMTTMSQGGYPIAEDAQAPLLKGGRASSDSSLQ